MKLARYVVLTVLFVTAVSSRLMAAPVVDGFWDYNNADGYTLFSDSYIDLGNGNAKNTAILGLASDSTYLYVMYAQQTDVNSNAFANSGTEPGLTKGHTFSDLLGSDHIDVDFTTPKTYIAGIDYVSDLTQGGKNTIAVGDNYNSDGELADGSTNTGTSAHTTGAPGSGATLVGWASSLGWDLHNATSACITAAESGTENSPATDLANEATNTSTTAACQQPGDDWLYGEVVELQFTLANLGLAPNVAINQSLANMINLVDIHNSPAVGVGDTNLCDSAGSIVGPSGSNASVQLGCSGITSTVPEPASIVLLGTGILGASRALRRRKKQ